MIWWCKSMSLSGEDLGFDPFWVEPKSIKLIFTVSLLFYKYNVIILYIHLLSRRPKLGKILIYSNKFYPSFHLFYLSWASGKQVSVKAVRALQDEVELDLRIMFRSGAICLPTNRYFAKKSSSCINLVHDRHQTSSRGR